LKGFIIGDSRGDTYRQAGQRLNMSESAAKKAASRIRQRYRELLREEILHTVGGPDEIDDEIRSLFLALES
jgi:RNA polymerase sigma-70 factor (ECF subfamily)